jgi:hypothetical protein
MCKSDCEARGGCSAKGHRAPSTQDIEAHSHIHVSVPPVSLSQSTHPIDGDTVELPSSEPTSPPMPIPGVRTLSFSRPIDSPLFQDNSESILSAQHEHRIENQMRRVNATKVKTTVLVYFWVCLLIFSLFLSHSFSSRGAL